MNRFMHYLYCNNIQKSVDFYVKLGFFVHSDSRDGCAVRHVRLSHPECDNMLIALEDFSELLALSETNITIEKHPLRVALTIVTDDYFAWNERFARALTEPTLSIHEPYGFWIYYHDPCENLVCISNTPLW